MKQQENNDRQNQLNDGKRGFGYASFALSIIAIIFIPLIFVISIYGLCASALCSLASLAFYNSQKKHGIFSLCKIARVIAYIALVICMLVLIGGIIYSATL